MNHCYSYVSSDDEFNKLVVRMNPPCVRIENKDAKKHTLIMVDSANKRGCLLQVLEVLSDLNLIVKKAYISSDGGWFMDVFHVTDELGNKLVYDASIVERIEKVLKPKEKPKPQAASSSSAKPDPNKPPPPPPPPPRTTIELSARDRPGLLSEVFAVLRDQRCNIVSADAWTYNSRMSSNICITDEVSGLAIKDEKRLDGIKQLLVHLLKGSVSTVVTDGLDVIDSQRRLHQMMQAELDCYSDDDDDNNNNNGNKAVVTIQDITDRRYTFVTVVCPDRPKLVFDTVCTITDMQYVVFHGTIYAEHGGPVAEQEYFIRHIDGSPITSDLEKKRLVRCIQAAIQRRVSQGIRVELVAEDRVGLLCDVTRVLRENGLTVSRAEAVTRGTRAVSAFYVADATSDRNPVKMQAIEEAVRKEMGTNIVVLRVKEETYPQQEKKRRGWFSLRSLFRRSN